MRLFAATSIAAVLVLPAVHAQNQEELARKKMVEAAQNDLVNLKRSVELARVPLEAPVKGAPYSADVIVSNNQALADGNHISHSETSHVFRDSEGRTRREQNGTMTVAVAGERVSTRGTVVSIVDPVAGYSYSLDAEHKIAWRTPIGASAELLDKVKASMASGGRGGRQSEPPAASEADMAKMKAEKAAQAEARGRSGGAEPAGPGGGDIVAVKVARGVAYNDPKVPLEHATIDGLAVEGRKRSETIPAGQIGNDQPIVITSEEWTSTDLKVLVLTKHNDPRSGESTYHLANVVRAEPDPSLFLVPPDYTVKDTGVRRNNE